MAEALPTKAEEPIESVLERHKRETAELRAKLERAIADDQRYISNSRERIKQNRALLASLPKPPVKRTRKANGKPEAGKP